MDSSEITKAEIKVDEGLPQEDIGEFFGFAIITDGTVYAVATHGGFFDSESQTDPANGCDATFPFDDCEEVYHDHLINFKSDEADCDFGDLAIDTISFEEIADTLEVDGNEVEIHGIPRDTQVDLTDALTGSTMDFTLGQPNGVVVSFSIYAQGGDVCAHIQDVIEPQKFKGTD